MIRVPLGKLDAFRQLPAEVTIGGKSFFLVQDDRGYRVLSSVCPHQGGTVVDRGETFECPIHHWRFDRVSGRCLNAPSRSLASHPVVVDDGMLVAELLASPEFTNQSRGPLATVEGLTLRLHSHACLEIARSGFTLLVDPWLDGPAFFSAWAPHPAPAVSGKDLHPDAILITHEHSDHFHDPTLRHFDRRRPIYVPDFPNPRLQKRLTAMDFRDVRVLRFGERQGVGPDWSITAFEPDSYWNDALVLIDAAGFRLFDINDAGLNPRIARMVGAVDLLAVQFSAGASGYPWTWSHLTDDQKIGIGEKMCAGKLALIREAASTYQASAVLPFASHFTLWHDQHLRYASMLKRNTLDDVKAALADTSSRVIDLMPGDEWQASRDVIVRRTAAVSPIDRDAFASAFPTDDTLSLGELVTYLQRLNTVPEIVHCEELTVRMIGRPAQAGGATVDVAFRIAAGQLAMLAELPGRANLTMTMPLSILTAVVRGDRSWDEAFIGYWCEFDRHPNVYHAGFWRLFQSPYFKKSADPTAPNHAAGITPASTVAEVLETYGAAADRVLRRYGLYCFGCHHSTSESIASAARVHGVEGRRVEALVSELNRAARGEGGGTL